MNYFLKSHFFGKNPGILLSKIGPKHLFFQLSGGVSRVVINSILFFHCSCIMPVQKWFSHQHCHCILIKKETVYATCLPNYNCNLPKENSLLCTCYALYNNNNIILQLYLFLRGNCHSHFKSPGLKCNSFTKYLNT